MFTRLLFLWATGALLLTLNWGTAFGNEEDEDMTPTPDYDYNSTLDYSMYYSTAFGNEEDEDMTPTPDYDYNSTLDYSMYYNEFEILPDTQNQGNTDSVSVYRHYGILVGLLVLQICQQT